MSFLYPGFLWALTALSIPIIIHLFNFRRTTKVYFSSTRFLKQVKEVTTSKRKIKHYLILASRLLFLFFLVIVFSQPIIPAHEQIDSHRNITLYLDNSLSMSAQLNNKTRALDAAILYTQNIIDIFPQETRYKLITNDFSPFSNTFKTKAEISDLLTQIRLSPVSRTAEEIANRISRDRDASGNLEAFWISDFQKSTFGNLQRVDSTIRWHLVPLSPVNNDNVFIDSVFLDNPLAIGSEKNKIQIRVRNDGNKDADVNLRLTINNIQAATTTVNVPVGSVRETSIDLTTGLSGVNRAHINFTDFPISFDNDFYFTLNFTEKIKTLEIKPSANSTPIEYVFGNRDLFSYQGFPSGNFNYSLLQEADLVIVNGVDRIDPSLSLALREYIRNDGTVLLFPGTLPDVKSYQEFSGIPISASPESAMQELDKPDFNNPFFENVFEERTPSLLMPSVRRIINWGADRTALLQLKNAQPFLSLFQQGGKLYIAASPLDPAFSNFANNALFVPIMYKIASSAKRNVSRPYYTLQENFVALNIDSLTGEDPLRLMGENEVVPSQRKVGNKIFFDLPKYALSQGFYYIMSKQDTLDLLAFDLEKRESLMAGYPSNELTGLFGNGANISVFETESTDSFSNEIKERYLGKPLWKYALMLALFFLLAEILLIRFLK